LLRPVAQHIWLESRGEDIAPVLGFRWNPNLLKGLDSLLSMVQMPGGVPVGTRDRKPAHQRRIACHSNLE